MYILHLNSAACQLYLNKTRGRKVSYMNGSVTAKSPRLLLSQLFSHSRQTHMLCLSPSILGIHSEGKGSQVLPHPSALAQ